METVVSGARPTGSMHLGNIYGAVKNFVNLQDSENCYFFVADYHSLTTHPKPQDLHHNSKLILAEYLACGLDPEKCVLYLQSDLPQIPELYLLFNMLAYKGELEKVPTFKEKIRGKNQSINAGLLTYPVLMAVDIIIHKATKVPVGKDQEPHLEMARNLVNRFNHTYGVEVFPEPQPFGFDGKLVKIPSLDASGKMSKSADNPNSAIYLSDDEDLIRKKVMRAKTDAGPTEPNSTKPEEIQNLFDLMETFSSPEVVKSFDDQFNNCSIRYGDLKKQLAEDILLKLRPIKENFKEIFEDTESLKKVVEEGAEKARNSAQKTLTEVRQCIGLKSF